MKSSIINSSTRLSLTLSACMITMLSFTGCTKERDTPDECGTDAPASGELRTSPVSFLTWTTLGTTFTIWKNGLRVGSLQAGMNPYGIQVASDNATSITVEGLTYQNCTTTVTAGTYTFQKGASAGLWGPYYDLTATGLPHLRFRILNGSTPIGSDAGGYFNLNNGTGVWSTHSTTGTYFQWATGVLFDNNCMIH
jgi:hypothetical protein